MPFVELVYAREEDLPRERLAAFASDLRLALGEVLGSRPEQVRLTATRFAPESTIHVLDGEDR